MPSFDNEEESLQHSISERRRNDTRDDFLDSALDSSSLRVPRTLMTTVDQGPELHLAHQRLVFTDPVAFRFAYL